MMYDDEMPLFAYGRTAGFVNQPASRERAQRESGNGTASLRAQLVLRYLENAPEGMTWRELGTALNLHHGQISGALSNLHRTGQVFMLRAQRNRCHPYCHNRFRDSYNESERIDEPTQTRAKQRQTDLENLLTQVMAAIRNGQVTSPSLITYAHELHDTIQ